MQSYRLDDASYIAGGVYNDWLTSQEPSGSRHMTARTTGLAFEASKRAHATGR